MRLLPLLIAALPLTAQADPLTIVTDIPPVQSLVSQVIGDRGTVEVLLDPNADPHHFQLRPSQSRMIAKADLLIWISEGMTPWLDRARKGIGADVAHLPLLEEDIHSDTDEEEVGHHHEDPHLWLDTHEAIEMVYRIEHLLSDMDPDGAASYSANADQAAERIEALTAEVSALLADVQVVPFAVTHDGYRYFVRQFGLSQAGSLTDIHDSPASVKTVSKLAQMTQSGEIACVFGEIGESNKLAQVLVEQGARKGRDLDPAGIAIERGPELYQTLIREMAASLKDCLSN